MTDWLALALEAVPIVPLAPIAPANEANGTIGTNGTAVGDATAPVASEPSDADVARAEYEERCAVLEYDEGLTRDDAERLAAEQVGNRGGSVPALDIAGPRHLLAAQKDFRSEMFSEARTQGGVLENGAHSATVSDRELSPVGDNSGDNAAPRFRDQSNNAGLQYFRDPKAIPAGRGELIQTGINSLRPADWMPEPAPGITILRPAVEVDAREYDAHLDTMIAALPEGSSERN